MSNPGLSPVENILGKRRLKDANEMQRPSKQTKMSDIKEEETKDEEKGPVSIKRNQFSDWTFDKTLPDGWKVRSKEVEQNGKIVGVHQYLSPDRKVLMSRDEVDKYLKTLDCYKEDIKTILTEIKGKDENLPVTNENALKSFYQNNTRKIEKQKISENVNPQMGKEKTFQNNAKNIEKSINKEHGLKTVHQSKLPLKASVNFKAFGLPKGIDIIPIKPDENVNSQMRKDENLPVRNEDAPNNFYKNNTKNIEKPISNEKNVNSQLGKEKTLPVRNEDALKNFYKNNTKKTEIPIRNEQGLKNVYQSKLPLKTSDNFKAFDLPKGIAIIPMKSSENVKTQTVGDDPKKAPSGLPNHDDWEIDESLPNGWKRQSYVRNWMSKGEKKTDVQHRYLCPYPTRQIFPSRAKVIEFMRRSNYSEFEINKVNEGKRSLAKKSNYNIFAANKNITKTKVHEDIEIPHYNKNITITKVVDSNEMPQISKRITVTKVQISPQKSEKNESNTIEITKKTISNYIPFKQTKTKFQNMNNISVEVIKENVRAISVEPVTKNANAENTRSNISVDADVGESVKSTGSEKCDQNNCETTQSSGVPNNLERTFEKEYLLQGDSVPDEDDGIEHIETVTQHDWVVDKTLPEGWKRRPLIEHSNQRKRGRMVVTKYQYLSPEQVIFNSRKEIMGYMDSYTSIPNQDQIQKLFLAYEQENNLDNDQSQGGQIDQMTNIVEDYILDDKRNEHEIIEEVQNVPTMDVGEEDEIDQNEDKQVDDDGVVNDVIEKDEMVSNEDEQEEKRASDSEKNEAMNEQIQVDIELDEVADIDERDLDKSALDEDEQTAGIDNNGQENEQHEKGHEEQGEQFRSRKQSKDINKTEASFNEKNQSMYYDAMENQSMYYDAIDEQHKRVEKEESGRSVAFSKEVAIAKDGEELDIIKDDKREHFEDSINEEYESIIENIEDDKSTNKDENMTSEPLVNPEHIYNSEQDEKEKAVSDQNDALVQIMIIPIGPKIYLKRSNLEMLSMMFSTFPTPSKSVMEDICDDTEMTPKDVKWTFLKLRHKFNHTKGIEINKEDVNEMINTVRSRYKKDDILEL